jgi:hypothetical protein
MYRATYQFETDFSQLNKWKKPAEKLHKILSLYELKKHSNSTSPSIDISIWRHLCLTYDGFRDAYKLYVNGEKECRN